MDIWEMRKSLEYRESIARKLADADVELAKANANPDLKSTDDGIKWQSEKMLERAEQTVHALTNLIAQLEDGPDFEIPDDGD